MSTALLFLLLLIPLCVQAQMGPRVTITHPTTAATYSTTLAQVPMAGRAEAGRNRQIRSVAWRTDHGASGTAQGTTAWSFSLTLIQGTTRVTVTATDSQNRTGMDSLTVTVLAQPGPITVEWSYGGTTGDAFQLERCTAPCGTMAPVAAVAIADRRWVDTQVVPADDYCYRMAVLTGATLGAYSNTLCSP